MNCVTEVSYVDFVYKTKESMFKHLDIIVKEENKPITLTGDKAKADLKKLTKDFILGTQLYVLKGKVKEDLTGILSGNFKQLSIPKKLKDHPTSDLIDQYAKEILATLKAEDKEEGKGTTSSDLVEALIGDDNEIAVLKIQDGSEVHIDSVNGMVGVKEKGGWRVVWSKAKTDISDRSEAVLRAGQIAGIRVWEFILKIWNAIKDWFTSFFA